MNRIFMEALIDSAKMIPFLLIIYYLVELAEHKYGHAIQESIQKAAKAGPAAGAIFGCVPQCGFSVLASAMYTRRLITIGTLIAVYLSTSDEAVPVILSQPEKVWVVFPLILTKLIMGVIGGYAVDIAFRSYKKYQPVDTHEKTEEIHEKGCCEHKLAGEDNKRGMIIHPLIHTSKVFFFIFIVTLAINWVGVPNLSKYLMQHSIFQPIITAIFGLIPNCATSVAITEIYLKGGISFGSAISGLSASGGLGMLVLIKENKDLKDTARVLGLLLCISIATGILIQSIYG